VEDALDAALEEEAALEELLSAEVLDAGALSAVASEEAEALSAASSEAAASSKAAFSSATSSMTEANSLLLASVKSWSHASALSDAASDELDTSEGSAAMDTERNILSTETAGITTATAAHIPTAAATREINFFFIE
jgi:hypothetical protein